MPYTLTSTQYAKARALVDAYQDLRAEYETLYDLPPSNMDGMPKGSCISDRTAMTVARVLDVRERLTIVEDAAKEASGALWKFTIACETVKDTTTLRRVLDNVVRAVNGDRRKFYYLVWTKLQSRVDT